MNAEPGAWPETRITSWAELQESFDPLATPCVFRGQGSRSWPLCTSFNRLIPGANEEAALRWEFSAIVTFRREAHLFLPPSVMPPSLFKLNALDTYLEWLMIMQHYGAPTRLLDWSQSPYVALYFAVIDMTNEDAAIWYFDTSAAEQTLRRHLNTQAEFIDYADYDAAQIRSTEVEPVLYTAMKKLRTQRETAQQGVFTLVNRVFANHQSVIPQSCGDGMFGRIIIPDSLKPECCARLRQMNVTAATLFPGVDGVCRAIRDDLRFAVANLPREADLPNPPPPIAQAE